MKNKLLLLLLMVLAVILFCADDCSAAVHVSGGSNVTVNAISCYDMSDASGIRKFRVILEVNNPFYSDYDTSSGYADNGYSAAVKFDNMILGDKIERFIRPDAQNADFVELIESHETITVKLTSGSCCYSGSNIVIQPKTRTTPCRIVIDFAVEMKAVAKISSGLAGKTVIIDPGHGGSDAGAVGAGGTQEKTVNLGIANALKKLLVAGGAKVIMTRTTDVDVAYPNCSDEEELSARVLAGAKYHADIFVSLHNDAYYSRESHGTATYYYAKSSEDLRLARNIQKALCSSIELTDKGVRKANFYVLRNSKMPAALVEVAFISNPGEERLLANTVFQQKAANGIYNGLADYFGGH